MHQHKTLSCAGLITESLQERPATPSFYRTFLTIYTAAQQARPAHTLVRSLHLVAAAQPQHQVQRALLLNVIIGQRATILQLLARKDKALLVRRDACIRK